ncbi:50S ribosomal protein L32 [candidate division WOR-3 bacterium]|nr:50S ribosomal protein L32 [candidate division WOR-3 bacterium]
MAVQKRRQSKTRGRKRRTHWKATMPNLIPCPNCKTLILPHTRCYNCGQYKGKEVIIPRMSTK